MDCKVVIDKERKEEVVIYAHEKTKLVEQIESLVLEDPIELIGYKDREAVKLELSEVSCFIVEDNKIYAVCDSDKFIVKSRLYKLEEVLTENFVKINQSCIANIKKIKKFDASFSGSLLVVFQNGYTDYVSRRRLKNIKERFGL